MSAIGVGVERLITIGSQADVADRRVRLVEYVWKGAGLTRERPATEQDAPPPELAALRCARVDRLTTTLAHGMTATSYLAHPAGDQAQRQAPNLAIYHTGHGNPREPKYHVPTLRALQAFLDRGWAAAVVDLPLHGWNHRAGADEADATHESFATHETPAFSALTFFFDPLAHLLNHAADTIAPERVAAIGFSGGGWAVTAYAALDERITHSYPVAGSWPFHLRPLPPHKPNFGDWEQRKDALPAFYGIAGYLDLYVLGAAGPGRRQLQILNTYDPACFPGSHNDGYATAVSARVERIGAGRWDYLDDATHAEHTVSPYALDAILHDLQQVRERT